MGAEIQAAKVAFDAMEAAKHGLVRWSDGRCKRCAQCGDVFQGFCEACLGAAQPRDHPVSARVLFAPSDEIIPHGSGTQSPRGAAGRSGEPPNDSHPAQTRHRRLSANEPSQRTTTWPETGPLARGDTACCYVCLGGAAAGELMQGGCGCRGSASFAHLPCLVSAAERSVESWYCCPTCERNYTGAVGLGLARAYDRQGRTFTTMAKLAIALEQAGELEEARRLFEAVAAGRKAELGPTHIQTLRAQGNLAGLLADVGELDEARRLLEAVVRGFTAQLGPAHSDTLTLQANLANLLAWVSQ